MIPNLDGKSKLHLAKAMGAISRSSREASSGPVECSKRLPSTLKSVNFIVSETGPSQTLRYIMTKSSESRPGIAGRFRL
jgi:hypothetical protein